MRGIVRIGVVLVGVLLVTACGSETPETAATPEWSRVCVREEPRQFCNVKQVCRVVCAGAAGGAGAIAGGGLGAGVALGVSGQVCSEVCESVPECTTALECVEWSTI